MHFGNAVRPDSAVIAAEHQMTSDIDGDAVILNLKSGTYHTLTAVGARIWHLVRVQRQISEICEAIVREYEVGFEHCEQDVLTLLNELALAGLIEVQHAGCLQEEFKLVRD